MTGPTPDLVAPDRVAKALDTVRAIFAVDGAELVDPPVVQPAGPYVDLSGEDVRGRLFLVSGPKIGRAHV